MNFRPIFATTILSFCIHSFFIGGAFGQQGTMPKTDGSNAHRGVDRKVYDQVLDIVFPREHAGTVSLVLRFQPNFAPPSQIVIIRGLKKTEVIEYTSQSGNIYALLNDILKRGGKEDAVEMAKQIRVYKKVSEIPGSRFDARHNSLLKSVGDSMSILKTKNDELDKGTRSITLDGTHYSLWYRQNEVEMSFNFYDQALDIPGLEPDFKTVKWMKSLRLEIDKKIVAFPPSF